MTMLKENFHNLGKYEREDEAFVEYMRYGLESETKFKKRLLQIFGSI